MLGKVVYVSDNEVHVRVPDGANIVTNIINIHVILEDEQKRVVGEVVDITGNLIKIGLLGEYVGDTFYTGVIRKPTLYAKIRIINNEELSVITGRNDINSFHLGVSPLYNNYPVYGDINKLFSNHLAIFGNSGSGKSCGVARILQNLFLNKNIMPCKANFLIFDAYGEYHTAFEHLNRKVPEISFKVYTTNQTSASKRNDAFAIISTCSTPQFNLSAPVQGLGYTRKFRDCFMIDSNGNFSESNLLMEYLSSFVRDEYDALDIREKNFYTFKDLEKALDFTLISEGMLHNEKVYSDAITLKVRLHSLVIGEYAEYFEYNDFISEQEFISRIMAYDNNGKAQIVNFNFEDVDDWFAKVITKFMVKLLFEFSKNLSNRASVPFNIFLEEAHRYVQKDNDQYLLGYNIFERVAKEGRKYGIILNLISQRPVELSETVISQVSNFLIFKLTHPVDIDYMKKMLPNINANIIEKQKSLQAGTCVAFGNAFKVPIIVHFEMPNPAPQSGNCNVVNTWQIKDE